MEDVTLLAKTRIPTQYGEFQLYLYANAYDNKEHMAFVFGDVTDQDDVLVRVHSECFTGDVMGSRRCDCGEQLQLAMYTIAHAGSGVIVYLRQEGRGIGLLEKLRAYNLQDEGFDTVDANLILGHEPDQRDYRLAAYILDHLGVNSVRLMTNNPEKIESLEAWGIEVSDREPLQIPPNADNRRYLETKAVRMNHLLDLEVLPSSANGGHAPGSSNGKSPSRPDSGG